MIDSNELNEIRLSLQANAVGLQNVYNEFKKYEFSLIDEKINELNKRLDHYEKNKSVKSFDLDISTYPMNIRINMKINTNFGSISCIFDYPQALEHELSDRISAAYVNLLEKLYKAHDERGGKYIGENDCKKWMDENGKTIVELPFSISKR